LGIAAAQRQTLAGEGPLSSIYRLEWSAYPYSAGYLLLFLTGAVFPAPLSGQVALAISHLFLMGGAAVLCAAVGIRREYALLSASACFSMPIWYGFVTYDVALGLALLTLAILVRALESRARRVEGAAALVLFLLYEAHIEAYAFTGVIAGFMALSQPDRFRRLGRLALISLPSLVAALFWAETLAAESIPEYVYGPFKHRLGGWQRQHLAGEGWAGLVAPAWVIAVGLLACALALRSRRERSLTSHARTMLGLALGSVVLHLVLPKSVEGGTTPTWALSLRTGPLMVCCALLPWSFLRTEWARWLGALVLVMSLLMDAQAYAFARNISSRVAPVVEKLRETRPGAMAIVLNNDDQDLGSTLHYYEHMGGLWTAFGAVTSHLFMFPATRLVQTVEPSFIPPGPRTREFHRQPLKQSHRVELVLVQGRGEPEDRLQEAYVMIWNYERWTLWQRSDAVEAKLKTTWKTKPATDDGDP
jgi:hypothetical protein